MFVSLQRPRLEARHSYQLPSLELQLSRWRWFPFPSLELNLSLWRWSHLEVIFEGQAFSRQVLEEVVVVLKLALKKVDLEWRKFDLYLLFSIYWFKKRRKKK